MDRATLSFLRAGAAILWRRWARIPIDLLVGIAAAASAVAAAAGCDDISYNACLRSTPADYPCSDYTASEAGYLCFAATLLIAGLVAGAVSGYMRRPRDWDHRLERRFLVGVGLPYLIFVAGSGDALMSLEFLLPAIAAFALASTMFVRRKRRGPP